MKLLEFLNYCTLAGLIHSSVDVSDDYTYDYEAEYHRKVRIHSKDGKFQSQIIYAVLHNQGVIVSCNLYSIGNTGNWRLNMDASLRDVIKAMTNDF